MTSLQHLLKDYILVMWKTYYIKSNPPSFDICIYKIRILTPGNSGGKKQTKNRRLGRAPEEQHTLNSQIFIDTKNP